MAASGITVGRDISFKVQPEVLTQKSQEVSADIRKLCSCFDDLERIINRTNYYWIGEAGDVHRKMYREQKDLVDEILRRLKEYPADLLAISQNYTQAEQSVETIANELSGDVIE